MAVGQYGVLRNAILTIDETTYDAKVKTALFTPETQISTYPVLDPVGAIQSVGQPIWTLQLVGVQDYGSTGICKYLTDHHGEEIDVVLIPQAEDTWPQMTATVIAMATPFGGTSGEQAEFDITLPVVGQPARAAYDATP